ncbi:hypothetical protein AB0467_33855 [Streptomyces sp. NPDC052095]|uniref:hypothetical protein n=1 Tax=unclassified Streptomyces TaxID=2593676 RepID=UPI00344E0EC7
MRTALTPAAASSRSHRTAVNSPSARPSWRPDPGWRQLPLFEQIPRDYGRLALASPWLTWAKYLRNPTSRIKVGQYEYAVLQPLAPDQVDRSVAAATIPATRLILALAAVHAARVAQIGTLKLDDVDIGNRRLTIAGRVRQLDDLTLKLLLEWLEHRRSRWPNTANLHLLINNQTATKTSRASNHWISAAMRGQTATLERLRVDRQLEEAMVRGPDPFHPAEVFGLDEKTAMRYTDSARRLLERPVERL